MFHVEHIAEYPEEMGISREQALDCWRSDDLIGMGMEADAVRRSLHPEGTVTYVVERTVCCTSPTWRTVVVEAAAEGAAGIKLAGSPGLAAAETTLSSIQREFPSIPVGGLSARNVREMAAEAGSTLDEILARLQAAGLSSLSADSDEDIEVHRAAHRRGLATIIEMRFGAGEPLEQRADFLQAVMRQHAETGGVLSFTPVAVAMPPFEEATAVEYLKTLAIARIMLHGVPHIVADWPAQGLKVLQMALRFGADDIGSATPGESGRAVDGTNEEDLRRVIRGAGFRPVERDPAFRMCLL